MTHLKDASLKSLLHRRTLLGPRVALLPLAARAAADPDFGRGERAADRAATTPWYAPPHLEAWIRPGAGRGEQGGRYCGPHLHGAWMSRPHGKPTRDLGRRHRTALRGRPPYRDRAAVISPLRRPWPPRSHLSSAASWCSSASPRLPSRRLHQGWRLHVVQRAQTRPTMSQVLADVRHQPARASASWPWLLHQRGLGPHQARITFLTAADATVECDRLASPPSTRLPATPEQDFRSTLVRVRDAGPDVAMTS